MSKHCALVHFMGVLPVLQKVVHTPEKTLLLLQSSGSAAEDTVLLCMSKLLKGYDAADWCHAPTVPGTLSVLGGAIPGQVCSASTNTCPFASAGSACYYGGMLCIRKHMTLMWF